MFLYHVILEQKSRKQCKIKLYLYVITIKQKIVSTNSKMNYNYLQCEERGIWNKTHVLIALFWSIHHFFGCVAAETPFYVRGILHWWFSPVVAKIQPIVAFLVLYLRRTHVAWAWLSNAPALRHQLGNEGCKEAGLGEAPPKTQSSDGSGVVCCQQASVSSSVEGSATAD